MYKEGVSTIIATVLVVLMTLAAGALVANIVIPFAKSNLEKGSECLPYREHLRFDNLRGFSCFNSTSGAYQISVSAGVLGEKTERVGGLILAFYDGTETVSVEINEEDLESETLSMASGGNLAVPKSGETRTYIYGNSREFDRVEVLPKLKNGRVCEVSDSIGIENEC